MLQEPSEPNEQQTERGATRPWRDFRDFQSLIDKLIGDARQQGHFDDLRGTGKPLDTTDDLHVAEEDRLGFRMLKSHGFAPPWMEARRDIEHERAKASAWLQRTNKRWPSMHPASRTAARVEYRNLLNDLRSMILNYNLTAPQATGQIDGIDVEAELRKLGAENG